MARKQIIPHLKVWLLLGKSISQREAIKKWNAYRLSHSIFILRTKFGMNIQTTMKTTRDSVYAEYRLVKPKPIKQCTTKNHAI